MSRPRDVLRCLVLLGLLPLAVAVVAIAQGGGSAGAAVPIDIVVPRTAISRPADRERRPSRTHLPVNSFARCIDAPRSTMTTDATTVPRFGFPPAPPRLRVLSEWNSTRDRGNWPAPPDGHGRPVMLVPGFLAGDTSLTRMALWLRAGGYTLARSGIQWNTNCMEETVGSLEGRLQAAVQRAGQPALLVGQSRGGSMGRALAVLRPDLIDTLVTLGSPLLDQLAVKPHVWPSILSVGMLGTIGIPGMFSVSCLRGACCARSREAVTAGFPDGIRFLSFYSRSDEVVRWEACLDPASVQIEVHTSHVGMGMDRNVWTTLAAELSLPRPSPTAPA